MLTISIDEANRDLAGTIACVADGGQLPAIAENRRKDAALGSLRLKFKCFCVAEGLLL